MTMNWQWQFQWRCELYWQWLLCFLLFSGNVNIWILTLIISYYYHLCLVLFVKLSWNKDKWWRQPLNPQGTKPGKLFKAKRGAGRHLLPEIYLAQCLRRIKNFGRGNWGWRDLKHFESPSTRTNCPLLTFLLLDNFLSVRTNWVSRFLLRPPSPPCLRYQQYTLCTNKGNIDKCIRFPQKKIMVIWQSFIW